MPTPSLLCEIAHLCLELYVWYTAYPLCVGNNWMFYDRVVSWANISDIPPLRLKCPSHKGKIVGQRYVDNNVVSIVNTSWSWHPTNISSPIALQRPFANNT